jgi:hypothetical protein
MESWYNSVKLNINRSICMMRNYQIGVVSIFKHFVLAIEKVDVRRSLLRCKVTVLELSRDLLMG